ncbi:hypothetical protein [Gilliamella apicola]|nr:hypothetical protein [Gilliamella apicola]
MLTETKLKALKSKDKVYKISDRDGLYATVAKSGKSHLDLITKLMNAERF